MQSTLTEQYLQQSNTGKMRLGLESIIELMVEMGNPERTLKIIHIAGTNGKGSTSQMIKSMLQKAGYKVGVYNSPHLITPCECISINDKEITEQQFEEYLRQVKQSVDQLQQRGIVPSFFEILTALAFLYFQQSAVDFVVLEVGLGGRLDATNVIEQSLISVITKIAIDHKDMLGDNLTDIAVQKAGIIKPNGVVITPIQDTLVNQVITCTCDRQKAKLVWVDPKEMQVLEVSEKGTRFTIKQTTYQLQLIGKHQAYNAAIALKVIETLKDQKEIKISDAQIAEGLLDAKWPGRFEKISDEPIIFIDGAHNTDGMLALADTIQAMPRRYTVGVVGVLKDKEVEEMLLISQGLFDQLIVTQPDNPRAMQAEVLFEKAKIYHQHVEVASSLLEAAEKAMKYSHAQADSQIIAFGSLYMIGKIKQYFVV